MTLGEHLKHARTRADLTQREVGKRTGINYKTLSNWENDVSNPSPADLKTLADVYHVTTDELLGRDAPKAIPAKEAPAPPTILMRAEQDLPPEKRKLLEDMAKALLGSDEKI